MVEGILGTCLLVVCLLYGWTVHTMKRKIQISDKIRQGYEKKCNTFRIKYTLLSKLDKEDAIIEKVRQINRPLYIYGGGIIGEKFLHILEKDSSIQLLRVIESNELKDNAEFGKSLRSDSMIIVTPMFDYDNIVALLLQYKVPKENIIGLDEVL